MPDLAPMLERAFTLDPDEQTGAHAVDWGRPLGSIPLAPEGPAAAVIRGDGHHPRIIKEGRP